MTDDPPLVARVLLEGSTVPVPEGSPVPAPEGSTVPAPEGSTVPVPAPTRAVAKDG